MENKFNDLIADFKLNRLNKDLEIIEKGIQDNVQVEKEEKDNIFKKFSKNVSNSVKKNRTEGLEKNKKADEEAVEKIKGVYASSDGSADKIKTEIESYLPTLNSKYAFGVAYLFSDTHEYKDDEETLKSVSNVLFGDDNKLGEIKKKLNYHYNKVVGGLLSSLKSNDALLLALQAYLLVSSNFDSSKDSYSLIKEAISSLNGTDENKKEAIVIASTILFGKKGLAYSKDDEGKNAFFAAKKESVQSGLALNAYLFEVEKETADVEETKNNCKEILASLNGLSYLCQVKMIIEKVDSENAKEKLSAINNYINDLADLLK